MLPIRQHDLVDRPHVDALEHFDIGRRTAELLAGALLEGTDAGEQVDEFVGGFLVGVAQFLRQRVTFGREFTEFRQIGL